MDDEEVKSRIIEKLLRNHSVGANATQIDSVTAWFPSHQEEVVRDAVVELLRDSSSPIEEAPGVAVTNVRLSGVNEAVEYLQSRGGEVPWAFRQPRETEHEGGAMEVSPTPSEDELYGRISNLEDELEKMDEAAEDWRSEARRRQRLSIAVGAAGFVLGIITSGVFSYYI